VHIRFEDEDERKPFAVGISVNKVAIQSTDSEWKPTFVDTSSSPSSTIMKLVEINELSVYVDTDTGSLKNLSSSELCKVLEKSIPSKQSKARHSLLVQPVCAWLKLALARGDKFNADIPKVEIFSNVEEIAMSLEQSQYHALLSLLEVLQFLCSGNKVLEIPTKSKALR